MDVEVELTRPDEQFGDYATNVALQLAGKLNKQPREIAEALAAKLRKKTSLKDVEVAGPGFINMKLDDSALLKQALAAPDFEDNTYKDQIVVLEYSDPNPFKVLHAGHLYTSVVGDAIANLMARAGATTHRVNFGGDVGLHAGKTMWAIMQELDGENPDKLAEIAEAERSDWMASCYVKGTQAYEEDADVKEQIIAINKHIYELHDQNDHDSPFAKIYWTCRQWSYDYFDAFYERIGSHFEKYYPESEVSDIGIKTVSEHMGKVFELSDGAVVFRGEPYGLHTRVFINSKGLPTYEAKDIGLIMKKKQDYNFDRSVIITGNEQQEYMTVVLKAIEQFAPGLAAATSHLTHGLVKLKGGVKMSSRKGNFLRASEVIDMVADTSRRDTGKDKAETVLGAIKYTFIKHRIGADIIFDPKESVATEGNSGPYLQYAHARARSVLAKVSDTSTPKPDTSNLENPERSLARKISEYPEVVRLSISELMPHHICTYLYELAQTFNRFYEHNRVIDDPREALRLRLVAAYADTLKSGLKLLGIHAPDKM